MDRSIKRKVLISLFLLIGLNSVPIQSRGQQEPDETIKNEIASISLVKPAGGNIPARLEEIPLKKCSDKHVYFEKGNLYDNDLSVMIVGKDLGSGTVLHSLQLLFGRYGKIELPDSALTGIAVPAFCIKHKRNNKPLLSYCRVMRSEDKKRVYIYMLNGHGQNREEVVWIIKDKKYAGRMLTSIPG